MSSKDRKHYAKKHHKDTKIDNDLKIALKKQVENNKVSCASAHGIAKQLKCSPKDIGTGLDLLEIRIVKCQMGLFGHDDNKEININIDPIIKKEIEKLLSDNRISCKDCWEISEKQKISKKTVASICNNLNIKIFSCQLGAF